MSCEHCKHCKKIKDACVHPPDKITTTAETETFYSRVGCRECNQWLEPVKLKRDKYGNSQST